MFERGLYLFGKKGHWISHAHFETTLVYKPWVVNEYRYEDAVFHIQATPPFYLEKHFRIEAMAYEPILQAALEYKPRGLLPGTYGTYANINIKQAIIMITGQCIQHIYSDESTVYRLSL